MRGRSGLAMAGPRVAFYPASVSVSVSVPATGALVQFGTGERRYKIYRGASSCTFFAHLGRLFASTPSAARLRPNSQSARVPWRCDESQTRLIVTDILGRPLRCKPGGA